MKKAFCILFITSVLFSCNTSTKNQKDEYLIKGKLTGDFTGMAYLLKRESGSWLKLDSVGVREGEFEFRGKLEYPEMYYIELQDREAFVPVFVENAEITFIAHVDSLGEADISGSNAHDEYCDFQASTEEISKKFDELDARYKDAKEKNDTQQMDLIDSLYDATDREMKDYIRSYSMEHRASVVSPYIMYRNSYYFELADLEPVVNNFDSSLAGSVYLKNLKERVDILKRVEVGQPAVDFTLNDPDGQPVKLSSKFGKYLLVDFWASWCGPCRQENPHVVAVFKKYGSRGFDVFGVSFDKEKDKWLKAVKDDHLAWTHVSDLKGWGNEAGKLYGINSIPSNVLLDKEGKIIAKNLRGEELGKKLEELLGK